MKLKAYKGKSLKAGGGGKFAKEVDAIMKTGKTKEQASAIAASNGRKKYGIKKFQQMATTGLRRSIRIKKLLKSKK